MSNLLSSDDFQCRVSSVLNRNVKEFGKKYLFDGREDTCWNSDQGSPQWIQITFEEVKTISEIKLMFQGGFAGKNCHLEVSENDNGNDLKKCSDLYPDDSNKLQTFHLQPKVSGKVFRLVFNDSTDFFGRVTIYQFKMISDN